MNRTEHREDKWNFPFVAYAPERTDKKIPLVVQLHGAGEGGWGKEELDLVEVHGFSTLFKENEYECMLVMPQCPPDTFWAAKIESLVAFIEKLIEEYHIDENRVYLTGSSMGGYGTWFTAMARPDLFAAIAPVCGGGMAWRANVLKMPVWAFHGAEDTVVTPVQSEEMVNKLKEYGADVTYTKFPGLEHMIQKNAYTAELLEWMLGKVRTEA